MRNLTFQDPSGEESGCLPEKLSEFQRENMVEIFVLSAFTDLNELGFL